MKKLLALILIFICLFSAVACSDDEFEPVESTEKEKEVLMTFTLDGEDYEVRYELYRALFLNFSDEYDGGDKSYWSKPESKESLSELNGRIENYCLDLFATLHLSKKIGYDPYSSDADSMVNEYISESVNGSDLVEGFDGDYDAYLASLTAMNLNYSVQTLLYRYAIAYDYVIEYYKGTVSDDNPTADMTEGALEFTADDVLSFYKSSDSVRVSFIQISSAVTEEAAKNMRDKIAAAETEGEALMIAMQYTLGVENDVLEGTVIGRNSLDSAYYSELTEAAFSLGQGKTSELIRITADDYNGYVVLYGLDKDLTYYEENYDSIADVYVSQKIGELIESIKLSLGDTKATTDAYENLNHSGISMQ